MASIPRVVSKEFRDVDDFDVPSSYSISGFTITKTRRCLTPQTSVRLKRAGGNHLLCEFCQTLGVHRSLCSSTTTLGFWRLFKANSNLLHEAIAQELVWRNRVHLSTIRIDQHNDIPSRPYQALLVEAGGGEEETLITELKNQIPVEVAGRGQGLGIALVDHGPDHEIVVIVQLKSGEISAEKLPNLTGIGVYVTGQPHDQLQTKGGVR